MSAAEAALAAYDETRAYAPEAAAAAAIAAYVATRRARNE